MKQVAIIVSLMFSLGCTEKMYKSGSFDLSQKLIDKNDFVLSFRGNFNSSDKISLMINDYLVVNDFQGLYEIKFESGIVYVNGEKNYENLGESLIRSTNLNFYFKLNNGLFYRYSADLSIGQYCSFSRYSRFDESGEVYFNQFKYPLIISN